MRKLMILLFLSQGIFAQIRENKPLPIIPKKPVKVLDEGITGWSLSLDGQWVSEEMTIPVRLISTNEDQYETKINSLGNDNIEELRMYPVLYGSDSLLLLVKIYETGYYKYNQTKKGWKDYSMAYYFIFNYKELQKLDSIGNSTALIELPLRDYGKINKVKKRKLLEDIQQKVVIKPRTDQFLTFTIRKVEESERIQFQFASLHDFLPEVEGVLHDFQIRGESLYGEKTLLDYIQYEIEGPAFHSFFAVPPRTAFAIK